MGTDIAIVGIGCRLPGDVTDLDALWRVLLDGRDLTGPVPPERTDAHAPDIEYVGSFLRDIDAFDAGFFGVSPREAYEIDPQQRLLLEVAWAAMEHAGIPRERWEGSRTGVYLGILAMDYAVLHARTLGMGAVNSYYASGKEFSFGAGRIAYTFGLHGPCLTLNAACASSLMAVHLAAQALRSGECDAALAGGVNLMVGPELTIYMNKIQALSPSHLCRPFDAAADGVVRGEGCGIIVLKRYTDAVADGDRIWAVVKGSAANHDGRSAGLTAPNPVAQRALLRTALDSAGLDPAAVHYVEAHSTGTPLGDPIELSALGEVYGAARPADRPLLIGSHKANFGHLDSAAGILGLLKAMLVVRHGTVPPQIKLAEPTPRFRWAGSGLSVPTAAVSLSGAPFVAGVSAFGLSGSNAHVLLSTVDTAVVEPAESPVRPVLTISAPSPAALRAQALAYQQLRPSADVVYSAAARRTHHAYRLAVLGDALGDFLAGKTGPDLVTGDVSDLGVLPVVHVFSGQGSQWPAMGLDLYDTAPVFRATLDECDALFRELGGWSLLDELRRGDDSRLTATEYAQPAVFATQLALSRLWTSWGVAPRYVVGHSMGEVAAACAAGTLALPDAARLILHRGRLLQQATGSGRMVAVEASAAEVAGCLTPYGGQICVATVNGPRSIVLAGPAGPLDEVVARLRAARVVCLPLGVDYAFHSPAVHRYGDELERLLTDLPVHPASVPWLSTVDSTGPVPDAAYWGRNLRDAVRFWPAVDRLLERGPAAFVELGAHPVLGTPLRAALAHRGYTGPVVGSLSRNRPAAATLARALATLYAAGVPVDWTAVYGQRTYVPLPPVPLARDRYWLPAPGPVPAPAPVRGLVAAPEPAQSMTTAPVVPPPVPSAPGNGTGREALARTVSRLAAEALGYPADRRVARARGFYELGMDSLTLTQFVERLGTEVGRPLAPTAGIDHPTIDALTDHLLALPAPPMASVPTVHSGAELAVQDGAALAVQGGPEPVAIVGMGCRFPRAAGLDAYWRLLCDGVDATGEIPADRWDAGALLASGACATRRGAFLDRIDLFDNGFFRVSAREARAMDPQQRLFLEVAWEALDDAGIDAHALQGGRTGLFVGLNTTDYQQLLTSDPDAVDLYYGTGNSFSGTAGRLSYFLGTRGPSLAVDTACSSSLVAVHLALQSLRSGESDVAIVGGANAMATATVYRAMSAGGALAPDGRCKTFDASADGYGRGEGAGAVVLKRLPDALADGDRVYAVLAGSAVNHNGASGGLTVPSRDAQAQLIRTALDAAGTAPGDVGYVEVHGTGTRLGDAVELGGLADAFRDGAILAGSVKTNIGHLEAAAGIAGLVKVALSLHHGQIPPHLHLTRPTDQVDWNRLPVRVPTRLTPWPDGARAAGVSAFGFTGTNAHAVLVPAPSSRMATPSGTATASRAAGPSTVDGPLVLSAASEAALDALRLRWREHLAAVDEADLADTLYTAAARRTHHEFRLAVVGHTRAELSRGLAAAQVTGVATPGRLGLAYGDGVADRPWSSLDATEPAFRGALDEVDAACAGRAREALYRGQRDPLAVFAAHVALTALWRAHGVTPQAWFGSGTGEVSAAYAAGTLDLASAVRTVSVGRNGNGHRPARPAPVDVDVVLDVDASTVDGLARLYVQGCRIDWARHFGAGHRVVSLPAYPWQHRRHWVESRPATRPEGPFVPADAPGTRYYPVRLPATGAPALVAALLSAARDLSGGGPVGLRDLVLHRPQATEPAGQVVAQRLAEPDTGWALRLVAGDAAHPIATATVTTATVPPATVAPVPPPLAPGRGTPVASDATDITLLDAVLREAIGDARIPTAIDALYAEPVPVGTVALEVTGEGDARVVAPDGRVVLAVTGLRGYPRSDAALPDADRERLAGRLHTVRWQPVELADGTPTTDWVVRPATPQAQPLAQRMADALRTAGARCGERPDATTLLVAAGGTEPEPLCDTVLRAIGTGARTWVLTAGAREPVGTGLPDPAQSAVWGLGRALTLETTSTWGGLVDADPRLLAGDAHLAAIAARLVNGDAREDELCLRGGTWYAPRLVRLPDPPDLLPQPACAPDRWYVVVDGLAERHRPVVDALVAQGARRLLILDTDPGAPVVSTRVDGVRVRRVPLDGADLRRRLTLATRGEPIGGVLVTSPPFAIRPVRDTGPGDVGAALRAVTQVRALEAATCSQVLDFFCVLGAAAATWGAAGTAVRAAAEGWVDGFAAARAGWGRPVQVLRLMPRADTGELSRRDAQLMSDSGLRPLSAPDVTAALGAMLRGGYADLCVADVDTGTYTRVCQGVRYRPFLTELPVTGPAGVEPPVVAELRALPAARRESRLLGLVLAEVAQVLGEDLEVGPDQGFFELGMDSVMSVGLRGRLERVLGVDLPATLAFEFPTTRALTRHVLDLLAPPAAPPEPLAPQGIEDSFAELSDADLLDRLQEALASTESLLREGI
jgi:acyl transferase domain-containing protein/acyl carrier protein